MKALDVKLKVFRLLTETEIKMKTSCEGALKALNNEDYTIYQVFLDRACQLRGEYHAYMCVYEMLLNCDEINEQYEAEAKAEEEEK